MKIKFCGAAEGVTGSCHLITAGTEDNPIRILLDCGMYQGNSKNERQNFDSFPFNPWEIDFLILSHAHIDHCGRIPLLVKRGFTGDIYCSDATADLLGVMLRDSAYIQEKEAEWKSRKEIRAGRSEVDPLYTLEEAEVSLKQVIPVKYDTLIEPIPGTKFVLNDAGHLIGSAIVELWAGKDGDVSKIVFSGDLGVPDRPLLSDPTIIKKADVVIMESTYGSRVREENNVASINKLAEIILDTADKGGSVVIPSFAVGRTQELIYELNEFYDNNKDYSGKMKNIKVYIDSPMATAATQVFNDNAQALDEEYRAKVLSGDHPLEFANLVFTKTTEESKAINFDKAPKIVISASGMCEAGRIRHHLKHHLWKENSAVVFVGYQAEGTLGRRIIDGAKSINIFGEEVSVNAKIYSLEGFSGHADKNGLLSWAKGFINKPPLFFLVHGEIESKLELAESIKLSTGISPVVVERISEFSLDNVEKKTSDSVLVEFRDETNMHDLRDRVITLRESLDSIFYKTMLAASENTSPEEIAVLKEKLFEFEKSALSLATVTSDRVGLDEEPPLDVDGEA